MKIAILSDVHGNLPALEIVAAHIEAWRADIVVVNGDVVNRGPLSRACWALVQERRKSAGWQVVVGNHEVYTASWGEKVPAPGNGEFEINRSSYWTYCQLDGAARSLSDLPEQLSLSGPDMSEVRVVHTSMAEGWRGIYPDTTQEMMTQLIAPAPAVFCTAHTHRPFIRHVNGSLVVNSGAAGTTFDGDPRASYAQLTWQSDGWQAEIVRLPYNRARMERDFLDSGFLEGAGPLAEIFFWEWFEARSLIPLWSQAYAEAVAAGDLDLATSVRQFLRGQGVIPSLNGSDV